MQHSHHFLYENDIFKCLRRCLAVSTVCMSGCGGGSLCGESEDFWFCALSVFKAAHNTDNTDANAFGS